MHETRRAFLRLLALGTVSWGPGRVFAGLDDDSRTPVGLPSSLTASFFAAASAGNLAEVKRLLAKQPELLGARNAEGRTAFALALLMGHRPVAEHLKQAGYESDLHEAALAGDWVRFEALATAGTDTSVAERVNAHHPIGGTTMFAAATGGAGSDIWRIYAQSGDPNRSTGNSAPLQGALRYRDLATAELTAATLLGNAADPDGSSRDPERPLHIAAARGSSELVEMLVRLGADVTATDSAGRTAADVAQRAGHGAVHARLVDHDAIARTCQTSRTAYDVNGAPYQPPDISGLPLSRRLSTVGQSHRNLDAVKELITSEPRLVHSVATTSEICIETCAHTGQIPIVDYLAERGAPYSLPTAIVRGDLTSAKRLLDEDPRRIQERGAHDFPLLWYPAIGHCDLSVTEFLLARGCRVEEQHHLGTTALHWASLHGLIDLAALLLSHGAAVNRCGRKFRPEGETPLQCAERAQEPKMIDFLKSRGAK